MNWKRILNFIFDDISYNDVEYHDDIYMDQ